MLAERGMVLVIKDAETDALPERYKLWTVASVNRSRVKLLGWTPGCLMEATATFPDGEVTEPWQVFDLSQRDLAHVYAHWADVAASSVPNETP